MSVLKTTKNFYDYSTSDNLAQNLKDMLSYGLIQLGAYTNAIFSNSSTSGLTTLKKSTDPRYTDGTVFEGLGPSWIWQSGVNVPNGYTQPVVASGVYVNNTFYHSNGSGSYGHVLDFKSGRVIFNSALGNATVKCQYSFPDVAVYLADDPKYKIIIHEYFEKFAKLDTNQPSGLASAIKDRRVWLPCIVIEVKDQSEMRGLELGGGEIETFNVYYHVFAEEPFVRNRILDIISDQISHTMSIYDINLAPKVYNNNGTVASGALPYTVLSTRASGYFITNAIIKDVKAHKVANLNDLFRGEAAHTIDIDRGVPTY